MAIYFSDEAQTRAAHIVNFASLSNNTRRSLSNSTSNNELLLCDFGDYNKKESGSTLVIVGFVLGKNDSSTYVTFNLKAGATYDGSYIVQSGGTGSDYPSLTMTYGGTTNGMKHVLINTTISGHTTTGNSKIIATYRSADGGGDRPFPLVNPNGSDDGALENGMQGSRINIWEVLL